MRTVPIEEFLKLAKTLPVIDVRSPGEFEKGHIPGANSIPVFKDDERAIVGTIYKQRGKKDAIEKGLEIVGPKMLSLAKKAEEIAVDGKVQVHCWRGGMRSNRMAWLFEQLGLECTVLEGGYKSYRNYLLDQLAGLKNLVILAGPTGSGKTAILHEMKNSGAQIIDLEGLATHRGSVFGSIGLPKQPSNQQFQNDLFAEMVNMDFTKPIWVESESLTIGSVYLPQSFWDSMNGSPSVEIGMSREERVIRLVNEYGKMPVADLKDSIVKIQQNFGGNRVKESLQSLAENNFARVAELLLEYYDKRYEFGRERNRSGAEVTVQSETGDPKSNAKLILEHWNERKRETQIN
ncbi:MAG: tRNA 2-selenouridine synthase [Oceanospirillaceae bacterium]|jgi:tRNA 2-selenouridine synthase